MPNLQMKASDALYPFVGEHSQVSAPQGVVLRASQASYLYQEVPMNLSISQMNY